MPRAKISEFSTIAGDNTDIDGINLAEGMAPSLVNDAIRELMAQLKDFQSGAAGDNITVVGTLAAKGTSSSGADLKLYEDTDNGTNYVGFIAPASIASNVQWTLPSADGSSGQALQTNGSGTLSFATLGISAGGTGQTTANAAFNALAPSQTSNAGRYLKTDGTNTSWDLLDISTADITGTLPVANGGTGITSFGTGVATALGINVGSSGAFVTNGGALGTPSSGTVTNLTGTASININGTVGATTPNTGSFTTVTNSGGVRFTDGSVERARLQLSGTSLQLMAGSASVAGISIDSSNIATFTNNPILSGGTANGVAYLNGSKVLTTGSALTFDGTRLLTIGNGVFAQSTLNASVVLQLEATNGSSVRTTQTQLATGGLVWNNDVGGNGASPNYAWQIVGTEQMRLTSTGLGIGTSSPSYRLSAQAASANTSVANFSGANPNRGLTIKTYQSNGGDDCGVEFNAAMNASGYGAFKFVAASTTFATIDYLGNLGLGVTPSAWGSGDRAIDIGGTNQSNISGNLATTVANGAYFNGTSWIYKSTGVAPVLYQQTYGGQHLWRISPSGTAGNAITFTQALTLNTNGALVLQGGNTSASGVGITFPATQSASSDANTLDDYEQGTWTPVTKLGTTTQTASNALGAYTKIGNVVYFACQTGDLTKSGTGSLTISLPFTASSTGSLNRSSQALVRWNGINPGGVVIGYIDPGTATVSLQWFTTTGGYGGAVDNTHCSATYQLYGVSGFFYMD